MSNIETPCPSCGNTTLFLDNTRRLVCTWIQCKQPVVQDKLNALAAELAAVKANLAEAREQQAHNATCVLHLQRKLDEALGHLPQDYVGTCSNLLDVARQRDHWKAEAVWAALTGLLAKPGTSVLDYCETVRLARKHADEAMKQREKQA